VSASGVSGAEPDVRIHDDGRFGAADLRELANVVRAAKECLARARSSTAKLAQSAAELAKTLDLVDATGAQLASANRELQSELSSMHTGLMHTGLEARRAALSGARRALFEKVFKIIQTQLVPEGKFKTTSPRGRLEADARESATGDPTIPLN
jgi:hypothetical protein